MFLDEVRRCIDKNLKFDVEGTDDRIREWEWEWVNSTGGFSAEPQGNTVEISKELYNKYKDIV